MSKVIKIHKSKGPDYIRIHKSKGHANGRLRVVSFKDGDWYVSYSPGLDMSGYGKTEKTALENFFQVVLADYVKQLLQLSDTQIDAELGKYNFKRNRLQRKRFKSNAPFVDKQGILRNLNLPAETKITEHYVEV